MNCPTCRDWIPHVDFPCPLAPLQERIEEIEQYNDKTIEFIDRFIRPRLAKLEGRLPDAGSLGAMRGQSEPSGEPKTKPAQAETCPGTGERGSFQFHCHHCDQKVVWKKQFETPSMEFYPTATTHHLPATEDDPPWLQDLCTALGMLTRRGNRVEVAEPEAKLTQRATCSGSGTQMIPAQVCRVCGCDVGMDPDKNAVPHWPARLTPGEIKVDPVSGEVPLQASIQEDGGVSSPDWLQDLCTALGWQGGTIHDALAEVRRLVLAAKQGCGSCAPLRKIVEGWEWTYDMDAETQEDGPLYCRACAHKFQGHHSNCEIAKALGRFPTRQLKDEYP